MTGEPIVLLGLAVLALAGVLALAHAALIGWNNWLGLRHAELQATHATGTPPTSGARIEMADLRERIRKLEAIAAGVDL